MTMNGAPTVIGPDGILHPAEQLVCLDDYGDPDDPCKGAVEWRYPLSATGRSFARCEKHWAKRLDEQEAIDRRYPATPPSDFDPLDAGEVWDDSDDDIPF